VTRHPPIHQEPTMKTSDWVALNSDWPALLVIGLYAVIVGAVWRNDHTADLDGGPQDPERPNLILGPSTEGGGSCGPFELRAGVGA
jgi:hypothetical protein